MKKKDVKEETAEDLRKERQRKDLQKFVKEFASYEDIFWKRAGVEYCYLCHERFDAGQGNKDVWMMYTGTYIIWIFLVTDWKPRRLDSV